jgi:DNA mismatch repair protein MutL
MARILGRDTARAMLPFEDQSGPIGLSGFLGPPDLTRVRAGGLYLFVNGRPSPTAC